MEWLGLGVICTFYWCFFVAYVTARWHWIFICFWLTPIYFMTINFEQGMEINGLMVLICVVMFSVCRRSLMGVSLWNIQKRKEHPWFLNTIHFFISILTFYAFSQAQIQGYMLNIQGWGNDGNILPMILTIIPMLGLTRSYSHMIYTAIDRLGHTKEPLTLLACHFFISNELGVENGVFKGYYVKGIQNGVTYHFRMTKRIYALLQKNRYLELELARGMLGGQYVSDLDSEVDKKLERQIDFKHLILGMLGFAVVVGYSIYYYWVL